MLVKSISIGSISEVGMTRLPGVGKACSIVLLMYLDPSMTDLVIFVILGLHAMHYVSLLGGAD